MSNKNLSTAQLEGEVAEYRPSPRVKEAAQRNKERAQMLRQQLGTVLRSSYSNRVLGQFIGDVIDFSHAAMKHSHIRAIHVDFTENYQFSADSSQLSGFKGNARGADTRINEADFALLTLYLGLSK